MRLISLQKKNGIATLTLNNVDESMNVVSDAWIDEMDAAIADVKADAAISGLIITSAKKSFMAGADLKVLVNAYRTFTPKDAFGFSQKATRMHRALETMGKPVVVALNGLALGGGYELALACHRRIIVDDTKAVVGLPEVNVGLLPGSGGTQRLPRMIGAKNALDALLSGKSYKPAEALKLGLVDEVVPADQLLARAAAWLATNPDPVRAWDKKGFATPESRGMVNPEAAALFAAATAGVAERGYNLPAPSAILSCVFEGLQLPMDRALAVESKYFARLLTDPVARNIIRTTFISKQAAAKGARRPKDEPTATFTKVGVLGAGMMGASLALVSAQAGVDVVLLDRDSATAQKGKDYAQRVLTKQVERGGIDRAAADAILARIHPTDDYAKLSGAELCIEAVFEDAEIKADVTKKAEKALGPAAIFATNTSTLPISTLANASQRPDQFIGMHFFSPVERMELVEIIVGKKTGQKALAAALDFAAKVRKTPIVVNDSRGFYTSRVFQILINEGAAMLAEGVEPARIENAVKSAGFPVGPLALLDEVTMDLPIKIVETSRAEEGDDYAPAVGLPVMYKMRELGRSSRKAGGGFYEYPADGKKHLWPGLRDVFPPKAHQPEQEELKKRILFSQAIETARCLEEGVLETAQDGDLGAVYGWGFPAWTGGTISYIDTIGLKEFVREADRLTQAYGPRFAPSPWLRALAEKGDSIYEQLEPTGR
ncbi:MAG: enoyl-CoA hydratase/isomerase family protein [Hyphomonadaceae bacterium]|nr:enoyl-CoA hydratase/isomerase family protein [Hyphomonadaceae bacterium]